MPKTYEDGAKLVEVKGYICVACRRFYGNDDGAEHLARACCAVDYGPCPCGKGRRSRHTTMCNDCARVERARREDELWAKLVAKGRKPWEGKGFIYSDRLDKYWSDVESMDDDLFHNELTREEARLRVTLPNDGGEFGMSEHLADDLPDDEHGGYDVTEFAEIDKIVNDWIKAHAPYSWLPDAALDLASLPAAEAAHA